MIIRGKEIRWKPLILALCAFCSLKPYYLWGASNYFFMGLIPLLSLIIILPNMDLKVHGKDFLFPFFAILFLFVCLVQGYNFSFSIYTMSLIFVPFIRRDLMEDAISYFCTILAVLLSGALLFLILVLLGVPLPSHSVTALNSEFYLGYTAFPPFLVRHNAIADFSRFCGPFDEPGVVGTICLILLYINKYDFKRWYNVIFLLSGLFAASFVFVGGSLVYLCYFITTKNRKVGLAVLSFLLVFYALTKDTPMFQVLFYNRMEFDSSAGKFAGDTRYFDSQLDYVKSIEGTQSFWFGDHGASKGDFTGARSILDAILSYGALFCLLYFLFFIIYGLKSHMSKGSFFLFIFILALILYQRPNFIHFTYLLLFSSFVQMRTDEKYGINNAY